MAFKRLTDRVDVRLNGQQNIRKVAPLVKSNVYISICDIRVLCNDVTCQMLCDMHMLGKQQSLTVLKIIVREVKSFPWHIGQHLSVSITLGHRSAESSQSYSRVQSTGSSHVYCPTLAFFNVQHLTRRLGFEPTASQSCVRFPNHQAT